MSNMLVFIMAAIVFFCGWLMGNISCCNRGCYVCKGERTKAVDNAR